MFRNRFLMAFVSLLAGLVVVNLCSSGDSAPSDQGQRREVPQPVGGPDLASALARCPFADRPLVTYRTPEGQLLFALQVRPRLAAVASRPRDIYVLVSTAASMGKGHLSAARKLVDGLLAATGPEDRVAIGTVNVTFHDLTAGLQPPSQAKDALKDLAREIPYGSGDLKDALAQVTKRLDRRSSRQQVVVYLGEGKSIVNPITVEDRARLCRDMVEREIAFFPIPLGMNLDPQNLHGLATGTGGAPVRLLAGNVEDSIKSLNATIALPILYPTKIERPTEMIESFPCTHLPPLRVDAPTLVIGRMKPAPSFAITVTGTVAGNTVRVVQTEAVPEPEPENFFLPSLVEQWRNDPDRPALLLAYAYDQNQLARADLLGRAEIALEKNNYEAAVKVFEQAHHLDPSSVEARAGLDIVRKLKDGTITKKELEDQLVPNGAGTVLRIGANKGISREKWLALNQATEKQSEPLAGPQTGSLLHDASQKRALEDQRTTPLVEEAIRQARRQLATDPEGAREFLKRSLDGLLHNPDLSDKTRAALARQGEEARRDVDIRGAAILQDTDQRLRAYHAAQEKLRVADARRVEEDRIQERMRVFHNYMDQGRAELGRQQATDLARDLNSQGIPIPPAVVGGYASALIGEHLHQLAELRRVRAERCLGALLQVEKSHVPFPDEPPILFPDSAT